jgi:diacylglycerol kinase family enzyme
MKMPADGVTFAEIGHAIERRGHELVCSARKNGDLSGVLDIGADLVVAVGGDGTVGVAARILAGRGVPLAILPLGTANNIAKSLGYTGSIEQLIAGWDTAHPRPLDLGVARGPWGEQWFVEGVGTGLIPAGIAAMDGQAFLPEESAKSRLARADRTFAEVLSRIAPCRMTLTLDGIRTTDDFVLIEVLNIRSVGPNIVLSGDADPFDGSFSVVMATRDDRAALARYLQSRVEEEDCCPSLCSQQAKHVDIQGATDFHVDDRVLHDPNGGSMSIDIEPGAVELWI